MVFVMAGGGTGGHVMPALAVARELRERGHEAVFIGTRRGLEARLAPLHGFPIEWIEIGGLKRVGTARRLRTLAQLPLSTGRAARLLGRRGAAAVFSLGGYAAGPVALAAWLRGTPLVILEPNAVPGLTNRWMGKVARRILLNFPEAAACFPRGRSELSGVPVRAEFFQVPAKSPGPEFEVLVTGGSQGSRTLNQAARQSWALLRSAGLPLRMVLQSGPAAYPELAREFQQAGIPGQVIPFIDDMPAAFARADLVVCRAGAGALAELAAAGKPALLVPFPYAADQHQLRNAEALVRAGAARMVPDGELDGRRLYEEIAALAARPERLEAMSRAVRRFARPEAARRAAEVLEEAGRAAGPFRVDRRPSQPEQ
jgi:UDP-N-acetylglucosamine--N-acetylmuramyl-(pentapeptide) pyrophosphoryl-undecaprenol N-acetylglucosamine transferase